MTFEMFILIVLVFTLLPYFLGALYRIADAVEHRRIETLPDVPPHVDPYLDAVRRVQARWLHRHLRGNHAAGNRCRTEQAMMFGEHRMMKLLAVAVYAALLALHPVLFWFAVGVALPSLKKS